MDLKTTLATTATASTSTTMTTISTTSSTSIAIIITSTRTIEIIINFSIPIMTTTSSINSTTKCYF